MPGGFMAKVLIIEDDAATRNAIRLILSRDGYEVIEAHDGGEGLVEFTKHSPDIVITDLIMPGIGGVEVVMELKRRDPTVRIIAISGDPDLGIESLTRAKKLRADTALVKPFQGSQLRNAMQRFAPTSAILNLEDTVLPVCEEELFAAPSQSVGPGISYQFSL